MLLVWLTPCAVIYLGLMRVSPTFREVVTLGAWPAQPKVPRSERRARNHRLRRAMRRRTDRPTARTRQHVCAPLVGVSHLGLVELHNAIEGDAIPGVTLLGVRRYDEGQITCRTTAEFVVLTHNPQVAVRTAERQVERAGLVAGATRIVEP